MLKFLALLLTLLAGTSCRGDQATEAGQVHSVYFSTTCEMPTQSVSPEYAPLVKTLRWAVGTAPEGMQLVTAIEMFAVRFGLTEAQATELRGGFGESYKAMAADPQCAGLTSAMDEVFATDPNRNGHYFAYIPAEISAEAPTIVFLHGYGGNLKFYIWALKESFSKSVIIAPTWGISWGNGDISFVEEVAEDAMKRFGVTLENKWLMGLSASGGAGFRVMNQKPSDYQGYICLASAFPRNRLANVSFPQPILMLNGTKDTRFQIQSVRNGVAAMKEIGLSVEPVELNADHFFLLTQRSKTLEIAKTFIGRHTKKVASTPLPHWTEKFLNPWGLACLGMSIVGCVVFIILRSRGKSRLSK